MTPGSPPATPSLGGHRRPTCVVVGAGVAGVAAAVAAIDRGWRPVVMERGRLLGGMARSLPTPGLGELDCGQHVVLRCCTAYRALLHRLGTSPYLELRPRLRLLVVDDTGRRAILGEAPLPPPLHLGVSLARLPFLGGRDRLAIVTACLRLRRLENLEPLDDRTFASWLGEAAATPARRAFWDLVCLATTNLPTDQVSAAVGAFVLRRGFLDDRRAAALGTPTVGLSRLLEPLYRLVAGAGGEVRTRVAVDELILDATTVRGVRTVSGEVIPADAVVLAGPPSLLARVAPNVARHPLVAPAQRLGTSPIVNLHLRFDRPVLDAPVVAVWNSPLQWLFSRSRLRSETGPEETVVCSLSAATNFIDQPNQAILDTLLPLFVRAQPRARSARLLRWTVTRERHATAALTPGSLGMRLGPTTPIPNLALAGAWTRTGWPITMESAARSGWAAVEALSGQRWCR